MARLAAPRLATFAELARLPDSVAAEIIHGELIEKALPTMEHGDTQSAVIGFVRRRFYGGGGGRWPGGWWIGSEVDVEYETHEIFRHDVVGWRRDRLPERPSGRPVRSRPDWVAEVLSTSNEKRDLVDKLRVLHRCAVPHYWILNPVERTLVVHRCAPEGYLIVLTASAGETVRAEPFDGVDLPVGVLFGDDDEG